MSETMQQIASDAVRVVLRAETSTDAEDALVAVIAAAEERGRRAGIEEAARALAAKYEHPERQDHEPDACIMCHDLETILALLAPRDSGKVP